MNHVKHKGKLQCKLLYKVFKEQNGYYPWHEISLIPSLIQLKDFLGVIKNYVIVVGK